MSCSLSERLIVQFYGATRCFSSESILLFIFPSRWKYVYSGSNVQHNHRRNKFQLLVHSATRQATVQFFPVWIVMGFVLRICICDGKVID